MRLTDLILRTLPQGVHRDDSIPGFGIRVGKRRKTFFLMIGPNRSVITLGHWPSMTLADARKKARYTQEPSASIPFAEAIQRYIDLHIRVNNKPSTARETERILRRLPFGSTPLSRITTAEIRALIDDKAGTPSEANNTFAKIRAFFRWAHQREYTDNIPIFGSKPYRSVTRERVLSDAELTQILDGAEAHTAPDYATILVLLIFTGQRKSEIYNLEWSFIDFPNRTITWPARLIKNNHTHTIPFGRAVEMVLKEFTTRRPGDDRLFSTIHFAHQKSILDEHVPIAPWRHMPIPLAQAAT